MVTTTRVPVAICVGTMVRTPFDSIAGLNEPRRGLSLHRRLGVGDFQRHLLRDFDRDGHAFVQGPADHHAFLEVLLVVSDHVGRYLYLVVCFLIHEMKTVAVLVEI